MEEVLKIAAPVIQAVSVAITAFFAVQGLRAWRRQLVGKRRFEVAEETVLSAYRVAEKLEWIRNGAAFDNEMAARKRDSNENESEARLRDSYWVPLKRIADSSEDFAALNKARLLARVHIGIEAANAIEELLRVRVEVHTASQTLVRSVGQLGGNQDFLEKMRCKIWAMDDEHDELTKRSKAALAKLDQVCLPHLR